jgi:hypothetical protein
MAWSTFVHMGWSDFLETDVFARLERLSETRGVDFNAVANEVLRAGLDLAETHSPARKPFRTKAVDLGPPLFDDPKDVIRQMDEEHDRKILGLE